MVGRRRFGPCSRRSRFCLENAYFKGVTASGSGRRTGLSGSLALICSRQLCCKPQMAVSSANSRASRLCIHPFDPLSARCRSHEWIRKVLCFPPNLVAPELHDAHGVGRLAVICQGEFSDPKIPAANNSSDGKPLFVRLTSALALYVASTAGSLA